MCTVCSPIIIIGRHCQIHTNIITRAHPIQYHQPLHIFFYFYFYHSLQAIKQITRSLQCAAARVHIKRTILSTRSDKQFTFNCMLLCVCVVHDYYAMANGVFHLLIYIHIMYVYCIYINGAVYTLFPFQVLLLSVPPPILAPFIYIYLSFHYAIHINTSSFAYYNKLLQIIVRGGNSFFL